MSAEPTAPVWIDDDLATDQACCGTKFATLARLRRWPAELRPKVPDGFVVRADAGSAEAESELLVAAALLRARHPTCTLAVRSSSPVEDLAGASFAGQFTSVLRVVDDEQLLAAYRACVASASSPAVLAYGERLGIDAPAAGMGVVVQPMVHEGDGLTGVVFSRTVEHPDAVLVELVEGTGHDWGHRPTRRAVLVPDGDDGGSPTVHHERVRDVARWARAAERHLGHPVDVEFAIGADDPVATVVQLRPLTGQWVPGETTAAATPDRATGTVLVSGLAVREGRVSGPVCRVDGPDELDRVVPGGVLVVRETDPRWLSLLAHVGAVVTDVGGLTSHAAIVCRELGVLALVGCGDATTRLHHGTQVSVVGDSTGRGYVEQAT